MTKKLFEINIVIKKTHSSDYSLCLLQFQSVLSEFVQIEMMFHARALKYLSECYEAVQSIDSEVDMDVSK